MDWFNKLFYKKSKGTLKEIKLVDRENIFLYKGKDSPFQVDHTAITHAFILTPKIKIPDSKQDRKIIIDEALSGVNPELWPEVLRMNNNIPTFWILGKKIRGNEKYNLLTLINLLYEQGARDQSSIYIGTPTLSFTDNPAPTRVYLGFAFNEISPKIIVSAVVSILIKKGIKRCTNCNSIFEKGMLICSNCRSKYFVWE